MPTARARLEALEAEYEADPAFDHLRDSDIQYVPGTGILSPSAMIIGESPGAEENATKKPFVGPAGRRLNGILEKVGINRDELYLTNIIKYWCRTSSRSPRPPTDAEIAASKKYIEKEIAIVDPVYIALTGKTPIKLVLPNILSVRSVNGRLIEGRYLPLYHPGVLIYKEEKYDEVVSGYKVLAGLIDAL